MDTKICGRCKIDKQICLFGLNKNTKSGYRSTCNDCRKLESKKYREENLKKRKETLKKYYENNRERELLRFKIYCENNQEKRKEIANKSYHKNKEKNKERIKLYRKKNKVKKAEYHKKLLETNIVYKISAICYTRIYHFLKKKNITKKNKTFEIIGCTPEFLRLHIEKQFTDGMSWDLIGKQIHIDHIIPLSTAKTEEDVYKLCHYTNLQPLWAIENLKKGKKIILI